MGIEPLQSFLDRHGTVALDSSIFIYHIQRNARYFAFTEPLFAWIQKEGHAVTSTLTMTEVLVQPIREGNERLTGEFFALLKTYPNLEWIPVSLHIAALGARYRAQHRLRTPDAILAATCVYSKAQSLVTNDPAFKRVSELDILLLDELL